MNKAEKYFKEDIINILANGYKDENPDARPRKSLDEIRKYI